MTKYKKEIGAWGESIAAEWLAERGYQIIARNVCTPYGEIDIIVQQGDVTIFVEVKTLTSSREFFPEKNITAVKQHNICLMPRNITARNMRSITGKLTQSLWKGNPALSQSSHILKASSRILILRKYHILFDIISTGN
jgi:Holliday junction resolvase-like predicted endonuclease